MSKYRSARMVKSEQMDLALIEAVRDHPDLYDKNSFSYNDYRAKERIWTKIATNLGIDVDSCRQRWKNIRDTFVKSQKKLKWKRVGPGGVKVNAWKYAQELVFLVPFIREQDYLLLCKDDGVVYEEGDFEITANLDNDGDDLMGEEAGSVHDSSDDEVEASTSKHQLRSMTSVSGNPKDPCPRPPEAAAPEVLDEAEPRPRKVPRTNTWTDPIGRMDDIEAFFYSMGQSVRKLPPHLQSRVKMKVCQVVTDVELEYHSMLTQVSTSFDSEYVDVKPSVS